MLTIKRLPDRCRLRVSRIAGRFQNSSRQDGGVTLNMKNKLRFYLGLLCYVIAWILPLSGFLVAQLDLSRVGKAAIISLVTMGIPEILVILAVVFLGKENLIIIKDKTLAFLKLLKPPAPVSRWRYRVGLAMFLLPLIAIYITAYIPHWLLVNPFLLLYVNLVADILFLSSLFVLGGDFWDKLRALFVYEAQVQFPVTPAE